MRVIAHISDSHLRLDNDSLDRLTSVVRELRRIRAHLDAVVFTGDASDTGRPEEYEAAARPLAELDLPLLPCPGNHDDRATFARTLLSERAVTGNFLNGRLDLGDLTLLTLDSLVEGEDRGELHADTLAWLEQQLATTRTPTVVGLHHPPVDVGHPRVDAIKLDNADELARIVARHGHVVAVLAGHAHTPATTLFAGKPLLLAPGISSSLRLPFGGHDEPLVDFTAPPSFALHVIAGYRVVTHFRTVSLAGPPGAR